MKRELKERYSLAELREIIHELRGEGGCPWDRSLTYESLKPFILDETKEVQEAVEHGDGKLAFQELGSVLKRKDPVVERGPEDRTESSPAAATTWGSRPSSRRTSSIR